MAEAKTERRSLSVWRALIPEISQWAITNFGITPVPYHLSTVKIGLGHPVPNNVKEFRPVGLDFLAPFMGMAEEIGELWSAKDENEEDDALGDIAIYFCDFLGRLDIQLKELKAYTHSSSELGYGIDFGRIEVCIAELLQQKGEEQAIVQAYGKLAHVLLKRFQLIRGMEDFDQFVIALHEAIAGMFAALDLWCQDGESIDDLLTRVWTKIVSKRDWNKERAQAAASTVDYKDRPAT